MTAVNLFRGSGQTVRGNELLAMRYWRQHGKFEPHERRIAASVHSRCWRSLAGGDVHHRGSLVELCP